MAIKTVGPQAFVEVGVLDGLGNIIMAENH
jgi:hypothetical protein